MKKLSFILVMVLLTFSLVSCVTAPQEQVNVGEEISLDVSISESSFDESYVSSVRNTTNYKIEENTFTDHFFGLDGGIKEYEVGGVVVQANDIVYNGNKTVVVYNNRNGQKGALRIIDWTNETPTITNIDFNDVNINSVSIDQNGNVVFVGNKLTEQNIIVINSFDINNYTEAGISAAKILFVQSGIVANEEGIVATDVVVNNDNGDYFVSLANVGGLILKTSAPDFEIEDQYEIDYVKSMKVSNGDLYAYSGDSSSSKIIKFASGDLNADSQIISTNEGISDVEAKAVMETFGGTNNTDYFAVTRAGNGFDVVKASDSTLNTFLDGYIVNGLSYNDSKDLLFVTFSKTDDSIGFKVYDVSDPANIVEVSQRNFIQSEEGNVLETIDLNESSANYVVYNEDINKVFAVTGKTGVFAYEMYERTLTPATSGTAKNDTILEVNDINGEKPEIILDFIPIDNTYDVTIFNYANEDNTFYHYKNNLDQDILNTKSDIFSTEERVSFTALISYLGFDISKDGTTYTNMPDGNLANVEPLRFEMSPTGNGELLVKDGSTLILVVRAYYLTNSFEDIFSFVVDPTL